MNKKIYLLLSFSLMLFFSSCKKDEVAPDSFTQKVIIEEFSGEWCGYCPDGAQILKNIKNQNAGKVFPISCHIGDFLEITEGRYYDNIFNQLGYPAGAVQRSGNAVGRGQWEGLTNNELSKTPNCGLKIETNLSGDDIDITVKYAGTEDTDAFLTVMIIENDVPESSPGAQSGAAAGYKHIDVLRAVLTDKNGDAISVKNGAIDKKEFNGVSLSDYDKDNVSVLAFIHKDLTGTDKYVYNAQAVKAGDDQDFD